MLQRRLPVGDVEADLALVDDRLLVHKGELDGVLNGEDVAVLALVDVVEHRGDGGALARAGHAGQDDQPLVEVAQLLDGGRQVQPLEGGDLGVDAPGHQAELAALLEQVDAEAALVGADDVGEVGPALGLQDLPAAGVEDRVEQLLHLLLVDGRGVQLGDDAPEAHHRRQAGLEVQVAGLVLHDGAEQLVDFRLAPGCSGHGGGGVGDAVEVNRGGGGFTAAHVALQSAQANSRTGTPRRAR
jgi:hypothetical protein